MLKEWKVYKKEPDAEKLAQAAGITPVVANLLLHRGIRTAEEAKAYGIIDEIFVPRTK